MSVSAMEPVLPLSPNSSLAFLFCNLIILMIILGSKFRSSDYDTQDAVPGLHGYRSAKRSELIDVERRNDRIERASYRPEKQVEEKLVLVQASEVHIGEIGGKEECEHNSCEYKNEDETVEYDHEAEKEDNGDDDELRRRIEDFIAKVNREWKEENLEDRKLKLTQLDQPLDWFTQEA